MSQPVTVVIAGHTWVLGRPIGVGGFGKVYQATSGGQVAAIKLIPKDRRASRDLIFVDDLSRAKNVIPIWGDGETETDWALLMPLADKSLRQHLVEYGRPLREEEARPILVDVAEALDSLRKPGVIHRDLKPENILLYRDRWCLADFGISRYVAATTAQDTWKYSTTRLYMAPEQWREEPATAATDIYAFGVVSHELLRGAQPFSGGNLRYQHLHGDPPIITTIAPVLAALVERCFFKPWGARPSPDVVLKLLKSQAGIVPAGEGVAALQQANLAATSHLARNARQQSEARSDSERRADLLKAARQQFDQISTELLRAIQSAAPLATLEWIEPPSWQLTLSGSAIRLAKISPAGGLNPKLLTRYPFTVIASSYVAIGRPRGAQRYVGRAHSLWYCDAQERGRFGWYEAAFVDRVQSGIYRDYFDTPIIGAASGMNGIVSPYALDVSDARALLALIAPDGDCIVASPFTLVEVGDLNIFIDRWAAWLAASSQGSLREPANPLYMAFPVCEDGATLGASPILPAGAGILPPTQPGFVVYEPGPTDEQRYGFPGGRSAREIDEQIAALRAATIDTYAQSQQVDAGRGQQTPGTVDARLVESNEFEVDGPTGNVETVEPAVPGDTAEALSYLDYAARLTALRDDPSIDDTERLTELEVLRDTPVLDRDNPHWSVLWDQLNDDLDNLRARLPAPVEPVPEPLVPGQHPRRESNRAARIREARARAEARQGGPAPSSRAPQKDRPAGIRGSEGEESAPPKADDPEFSELVRRVQRGAASGEAFIVGAGEFSDRQIDILLSWTATSAEVEALMREVLRRDQLLSQHKRRFEVKQGGNSRADQAERSPLCGIRDESQRIAALLEDKYRLLRHREEGAGSSS